MEWYSLAKAGDSSTSLVFKLKVKNAADEERLRNSKKERQRRAAEGKAEAKRRRLEEMRAADQKGTEPEPELVRPSVNAFAQMGHKKCPAA